MFAFVEAGGVGRGLGAPLLDKQPDPPVPERAANLETLSSLARAQSPQVAKARAMSPDALIAELHRAARSAVDAR